MYDYDIDPKFDPQRNVPDPGWQHDERYHVPPRLDPDGELARSLRDMARDLRHKLEGEQLGEQERLLQPFDEYLRGKP